MIGLCVLLAVHILGVAAFGLTGKAPGTRLGYKTKGDAEWWCNIGIPIMLVARGDCNGPGFRWRVDTRPLTTGSSCRRVSFIKPISLFAAAAFASLASRFRWRHLCCLTLAARRLRWWRSLIESMGRFVEAVMVISIKVDTFLCLLAYVTDCCFGRFSYCDTPLLVCWRQTSLVKAPALSCQWTPA